MQNLRWKVLPALLLLVPIGLLRQSSLVEAGLQPERGLRQSPDESQEPLAVQLSEIRAQPLTYLGQRVSFAVQFEAQAEQWNPLLTRFSDSQWGAFSGWSDDAFTWHKANYENPFARLYFPKGSLSQRLIDRARRYERFQVTATVRELFLGEPWIEVEELEPLFELVDEGSILHVARGLSFALNHQMRLAKEQFERARTAPLPLLAREEIERLIQQCP